MKNIFHSALSTNKQGTYIYMYDSKKQDSLFLQTISVIADVVVWFHLLREISIKEIMTFCNLLWISVKITI